MDGECSHASTDGSKNEAVVRGPSPKPSGILGPAAFDGRPPASPGRASGMPADMELATDSAAAASLTAAPEPERRAAFAALVSRKRGTVKRDLEERRLVEEATTERWSGLRIVERCIRQEKWDNGMRGKELVKFSGLSSLMPNGANQVLIGVLCKPASPAVRTPLGEQYAEWMLTDLHVSHPQTLSLVLVGRALDHWANKDGAGWSHAKLGSIFAILNPSPTGRAGAVRVSFETQMQKLGTCPSLAFCSAKGSDGIQCRAVYNAEGGQGYCARHAAMSHGERQCHQRQTARTTHAAVGHKQTAACRGPQASVPAAPLVPSAGPGILRPGVRPRHEAVERMACALEAAGSAADALAAITELGAAVIDADILQRTTIYDKVGVLLRRPDAVAEAARQLRRKWRPIMSSTSDDSRGAAAAHGGSVAKRPRIA
eukprot:gnl/TRDRNA2_/TRDRNA2_72826_c0_seq3.p1 gnl/TRDRNA2_/TRDRNA2_72826_c0~~gnl/TRDRNA2_/TRDRNA2_72826_c0_seq3.p1  ORF type:complete len:429 (+),score=67.73 gnl/TRDRNA2_/TRDRNA2_72826_c0_seq3:69-1355(+)